MTAKALPAHYVAAERIARPLARMGKSSVAKIITDLLPKMPQIRSGDLGATEGINAYSGYKAPMSFCI